MVSWEMKLNLEENKQKYITGSTQIVIILTRKSIEKKKEKKQRY